jgi:hypothetical protein
MQFGTVRLVEVHRAQSRYLDNHALLVWSFLLLCDCGSYVNQGTLRNLAPEDF